MLHTNNGQKSRLQRLRNAVPQGSVLALTLFNIYIHDLSQTQFAKYAYADGISIMHTDQRWQGLERTLTEDMTVIAEYLQRWRLKPSDAKTVTAAFHLTNKKANQHRPKCTL